MRAQNLKDRLQDWTDIDVAEFHLAQSIGLMNENTNFPLVAKPVFWSRGPVAETLYRILLDLVKIGVLEYREQPDYQFKWNPGFIGSWERTLNKSN